VTPFIHPTFIISILIAITVHECAHAYAATRLGDPTARNDGRLTLNPIAHIDPLGALMFILVGFGWAKPVPVNPMYFRHPQRDTAITALAGPLSNLILALIAFIALELLGSEPLSWTALVDGPEGDNPGMTIALQILRSSLFINLALMAFNLFPIAPLDGSKIVQMFVPLRHLDRYEEFLRIGPFILLGLILFESFLPFPLLSTWVHTIVDAVLFLFKMVV